MVDRRILDITSSTRAAASTELIPTSGMGDTKIAWPKPGETWRFNGKVDGLTVYKDAAGSVLESRLACRGGNTVKYFREVHILDVSCSRFVTVQGSGNMMWLAGWIGATDDNGDLVFDCVEDCMDAGVT